MDHIPDKALFAAVQFARRMMREGAPPAVANARAAGYYGRPVADVARRTGRVGGRSAARRRRRR